MTFSEKRIFNADTEKIKLFSIVLPEKECGDIRIGKNIFKVLLRIGRWHLLWGLKR
jgi:hypothetical protein